MANAIGASDATETLVATLAEETVLASFDINGGGPLVTRIDPKESPVTATCLGLLCFVLMLLGNGLFVVFAVPADEKAIVREGLGRAPSNRDEW